MTTKDKGTQAMGAVMFKLMGAGKTILLPLGDNERYDFVIEENSIFKKIQCKAGHLESGAVRFATSSTNLLKGKWVKTGYSGQVDYFGVHCQENNEVYLIPIEDVGGLGHEASIRVEPTKNKQDKNIRWASTYKV